MNCNDFSLAYDYSEFPKLHAPASIRGSPFDNIVQKIFTKLLGDPLLTVPQQKVRSENVHVETPKD